MAGDQWRVASVKRAGVSDGGRAGALFASVRIGVEATAKAPSEKRGGVFECAREARDARTDGPYKSNFNSKFKARGVLRRALKGKAGAAQDDGMYIGDENSGRRVTFFCGRALSGLGYGPRGEDITEV